MNLLLDTHVWLWSLLEPDRLAPAAGAALEDEDNRLHLSPVSIWETLLLTARGRLTLTDDPAAWVKEALAQAPMFEAPLTFDVALQSRALRLPHQDPADRFLAATAQVHDLVLVTADQRLLACGSIRTMAA